MRKVLAIKIECCSSCVLFLTLAEIIWGLLHPKLFSTQNYFHWLHLESSCFCQLESYGVAILQVEILMLQRPCALKTSWTNPSSFILSFEQECLVCCLCCSCPNKLMSGFLIILITTRRLIIVFFWVWLSDWNNFLLFIIRPKQQLELFLTIS